MRKSLVRRLTGFGVVAVAASIIAASMPAALAGSAPRAASGHARQARGCHLANGIRHVISITFDNVHLFRDNPNVPSDLEQMPHLYHFLTHYGTLMSNMHTPLIAHTAEDSLAIYSGLYGDRHGQPISNSYRTYRPDGTTESDVSFTYWTSPVISNGQPSSTDDSPSMVYSPTVPAGNTPPDQTTPEPWVAFTKAGCTVGDFSTANMVLENTADIQTVFGTTPPLDGYANSTSAFIGEAIHCGIGDTTCEHAEGAVDDPPPVTNDPGNADYRALFGHRYIQPYLVAHAHAPAPYQVADAQGNLVDLDGNEIADYRGNVGFPGFNPTATQSLAMLASMQEAGIPVTYGYISDLHARKDWSHDCTTADATGFDYALGPGDSCYVDNMRHYDEAFARFFDRLRKDGITPRNTLFIIGAEENDHLAGANVGRAIEPTPAGCDGVTTVCNYGHDEIGEVQANLPALLQKETGDTTAFDIEPQAAAIYVHGSGPVSPPADDPAVRRLERDTAAITGYDPYEGRTQRIVNYMAGATEQRILHLETADPQRTPTFTVFPKPDYYFDASHPDCSASDSPATDCVGIYPRYAWNHGYYSPDIDITWTGFVGPRVRRLGIDGPLPADSPAVRDPSGGGSVPAYSTRGTWADETDIRPTLLYLTGLRDDYVMDGRVITQILEGNGRLKQSESLGACYKQLNASVGTFGSDTLQASTAALSSGSPGNDERYATIEARLRSLADRRDRLATDIKETLDRLEFGGARPDHRTMRAELASCETLLKDAHDLAVSTQG